jgi:polysaccharide pyruvyl transferase WcaK-like protein
MVDDHGTSNMSTGVATSIKGVFRDKRGYGTLAGGEVAGKTAILLNNTAAHHGYGHFGTNAVTSVIISELQMRGISTLAYANGLRGVASLQDQLKVRPDLVVLNGEGTMHDNHERAIGLLLIAAHFHRSNIPCVLINTIWHRNTSFMATYLQAFDYISVRDSLSWQAITEVTRQNIQIVPDLFLASQIDRDPGRKTVSPYGVVDSADDRDCASLRAFAGDLGAPFYLMDSARPKNDSSLHGTPATLQSVDDCEFWVTGRYHFALAALSAMRPFVALRTRVNKMQGMMQDAELSNFLLDDNWLSSIPTEKVSIVREKLSLWDKASFQKAAEYKSTAIDIIASMFDRLAELARA